MHSHGTTAESPPGERAGHKRRLQAALGIAGVAFAVEVTGGLAAGSLALLADAAHLLTDAGALLLALTAITLAERQPTEKHTYGLHRAEILAAFVNAEILLLLSGYIVWEAFSRLGSPPDVSTGLMAGVGLFGLLANLAAMAILHRGRAESLNLRAAYLEVATDALASIGVVVAALVIRPTGWTWLDPAISIAIAGAILPRTITLLRQSAHILLEGAPHEIDIPGLRRELLTIPEVEDLHDLHFWTLTSGVHAVSVHVRAARETPQSAVLRRVQDRIREATGVEHATVQIESDPDPGCGDAPHHP